MNTQTLDYYNENAAAFAKDTVSVDLHGMQDRFIEALSGKRVLDFGCGAGRDTKYFLEKGLVVTAMDGSKEMCQLATEYAGIPVRQALFSDLSDVNMYDGIWACSSILHLPKDELLSVFEKMKTALTKNGVIYTSFKYSTFEGMRNGRYFTDFTEDSFAKFIKQVESLCVEEYWITGDARPDRSHEKWLNLLLKRKICYVTF